VWKHAAPPRRLSLGLMRGLNQARGRFRIPDLQANRLRLAPLPCRSAALAPAPSRGARGRAAPVPVSSDRTRGNDAGMEPATFPRRDE